MAQDSNKKVFRSTEEFERAMFPRSTAKNQDAQPSEYARELANKLATNAIRRASEKSRPSS